MILKVDFKQFLDEKGDLLALTKQAKRVFKFLAKIVLSVSKNIEQPLIEVDLDCNTRGTELSCEGALKHLVSQLTKLNGIVIPVKPLALSLIGKEVCGICKNGQSTKL